MTQAIYCVVESRNGWFVRFNGSEYGPAASRACAVAAALQVAPKAYAAGLHSQVLIHFGERFRTIWVNGQNFLAGSKEPAAKSAMGEPCLNPPS